MYFCKFVARGNLVSCSASLATGSSIRVCDFLCPPCEYYSLKQLCHQCMCVLIYLHLPVTCLSNKSLCCWKKSLVEHFSPFAPTNNLVKQQILVGRSCVETVIGTVMILWLLSYSVFCKIDVLLPFASSAIPYVLSHSDTRNCLSAGTPPPTREG